MRGQEEGPHHKASDCLVRRHLRFLLHHWGDFWKSCNLLDCCVGLHFFFAPGAVRTRWCSGWWLQLVSILPFILSECSALVPGSRRHGNCSCKEQGKWSNARKTAIPSAVGHEFLVVSLFWIRFTYKSYQIPTGWFQAMKEAGFFVPESFDKLPDMINQDSNYCSIDSSNSLHHFWVNSGDIHCLTPVWNFDISMCRFTLSWSWKVRLLRHQKARPLRHRCWNGLHQLFEILPSCITSRHAGIWMRQILREIDTEPVFLLLGHSPWKSHLEKPQRVEHKLQYPTNSYLSKVTLAYIYTGAGANGLHLGKEAGHDQASCWISVWRDMKLHLS